MNRLMYAAGLGSLFLLCIVSTRCSDNSLQPDDSSFRLTGPFHTLAKVTALTGEHVRSSPVLDYDPDQHGVYDLTAVGIVEDGTFNEITGTYSTTCGGVHLVALYDVDGAYWDTLSYKPMPPGGPCTAEVLTRSFSLTEYSRDSHKFVSSDGLLRAMGLWSVRVHRVSPYYGFDLPDHGLGLTVDDEGIHTIGYVNQEWGVRTYSEEGDSLGWQSSGLEVGLHYPTALTADEDAFWIGDNLGTIYRLDRKTCRVDSMLSTDTITIHSLAVNGDDLFITTNSQVPDGRLYVLDAPASRQADRWAVETVVDLPSVPASALCYDSGGLIAAADSELVSLTLQGEVISRMVLPVQGVRGLVRTGNALWLLDLGLRDLPYRHTTEVTKFALP